MEVANHYFNFKSFVLLGFSKLGTWIHLLKFHKGKKYTGEILLTPITWMFFLQIFGWKVLSYNTELFIFNITEDIFMLNLDANSDKWIQI